MKSASTTYIANTVSALVSVAVFVLPVLGFEVVDVEALRESVVGIAVAAVSFISVIWVYRERYKKGGINAFGVKKK